MGITGKYSFPGIQKAGRLAIEAALASTTWGASLLANGIFKLFSPLEGVLLDAMINWLANKGLIVLNLGAIVIEGNFDQAAFDDAMQAGLDRVKQGNLTPAQGKAIDDAVRKAFDLDVNLGAADGVSDLSAPSV